MACRAPCQQYQSAGMSAVGRQGEPEQAHDARGAELLDLNKIRNTRVAADAGCNSRRERKNFFCWSGARSPAIDQDGTRARCQSRVA